MVVHGKELCAMAIPVKNRLSLDSHPVFLPAFGIFQQFNLETTASILPQLLSDPDKAKAGRVMQAMKKMIKLDIRALKAAADAKQESTAAPAFALEAKG
jgi:hypothetical protein